MKRIAGAVCILFMAVSAFAAEDHGARDVSWFESWAAQKTATGNWGGLRDELRSEGVAVSCNYTADIGGNPAGGLKQVMKYAGFLSLGLAFDFQKIASIKGLALTVCNYLASGRDISAAIGTLYTPQEVYASGNYYLGEIDLSLSVMEDTMVFEAGRIFAGDIFAVSPFFQYYLTGAVNNRLAAIPSDVFFPHYQIVAWGVRLTYQPNTDWQLITGLYDADPHAAKINNHGADFSFDMKEGYLAVGQLTYRHGHKRGEKGLPGSASIGSYYESSRFTDLSDPSKRWHGNYGFYLLADQMIYKGNWPEFEGPSHMRADAMAAERRQTPYHQQTAIPMDRPNGLSLWTGVSLAPQEHINTQVYEIAVGAVYHGLPPNRSRDVTAFCFVIGHFSNELEGQSDEMILEFNHRFQAGPWLYITPDIQYIINPSGKQSVDDALVLGFETSFNF